MSQILYDFVVNDNEVKKHLDKLNIDLDVIKYLGIGDVISLNQAAWLLGSTPKIVDNMTRIIKRTPHKLPQLHSRVCFCTPYLTEEGYWDDDKLTGKKMVIVNNYFMLKYRSQIHKWNYEQKDGASVKETDTEQPQ